MERYYFDLHEHGSIEEDVEGQEFPSIEAVRADALKGARELMADDVRRGIGPDGRAFHVRNSKGETVLTLLFADAITERR